jgi:hypothetical protein
MAWLKGLFARQLARRSAKTAAIRAFRSQSDRRVLGASVIGAVDHRLAVRVVYALARPSGRAYFLVDPSDGSVEALEWDFVASRFGERPWL